MCQITHHRLSCCGHIYRTELVSRCEYSSWTTPCFPWGKDIAKRVLSDCSSCRQTNEARAAELTREYRVREAAMLEDAARRGWSSNTILELTLRIDKEREDAMDRLRLLSGPRGRLGDEGTISRW